MQIQHEQYDRVDNRFVSEKEKQLVQQTFPQFGTDEIYYLIRYADLRSTTLEHHLELMKLVV